MSVLESDLISSRKWTTAVLSPGYRQDMSRTAGGSTLARDLGPMLWRGEFVSVPLLHADVLDLEAQLMRLGGMLGAFDGYDLRALKPRNMVPSDDLSAASVSAIATARDALQISGLPSGFDLSRGDALSIEVGQNLHYMRFTAGGAASGAGETGMLSVEPPIRPEISTGMSVNLVAPMCRFGLDGTPSVDAVDRLYQQVSFSAVQVFE